MDGEKRGERAREQREGREQGGSYTFTSRRRRRARGETAHCTRLRMMLLYYTKWFLSFFIFLFFRFCMICFRTFRGALRYPVAVEDDDAGANVMLAVGYNRGCLHFMRRVGTRRLGSWTWSVVKRGEEEMAPSPSSSGLTTPAVPKRVGGRSKYLHCLISTPPTMPTKLHGFS